MLRPCSICVLCVSLGVCFSADGSRVCGHYECGDTGSCHEGKERKVDVLRRKRSDQRRRVRVFCAMRVHVCVCVCACQLFFFMPAWVCACIHAWACNRMCVLYMPSCVCTLYKPGVAVLR